MFRIISVLAIFSAISSSAFANGHECGQGNAQGIAYKYCIDKPLGSTNLDVLYYLHGGGGSEHSWRDLPDNQAIQSHWAKKRVKPPTVITVSFGPEWLLSEVSRPPYPSPFSVFTGNIMPRLEKKIGGAHGRRMIKGESMGGYNAMLLMTKEGSLFERVAMVCPGLSTVGPYSTKEEVEAFFKRHEPYINRDWVQGLINWAGAEFPTRMDWINHDPFILYTTLSPRSPSLHISCGRQDEYGFFEGAKQFADLAHRMGVQTKWQELPGGHCVADAIAIAEFLAP